MAFGSSLAAAADPARAQGPRLWAQITVYTGGAGGVIPAHDPVLMLAPILSMEALRAARVAEPYDAVWARACVSTEHPSPEDGKMPRRSEATRSGTPLPAVTLEAVRGRLAAEA